MASAFLTSKELAEFLAVPISTVRDWRLRGQGPPAYKFGRSVRFRISDVEGWIEAQSHEQPETKRPGAARRQR